MTKLAPVNFQLLDIKDNGQVLIIDALPFVDPKTELQREENSKKAKKIENEILAQQRIVHYLQEWIQIAKDRENIPTDDSLFFRKVGEILAASTTPK